MSTLNFSNWTQRFKNAFTAQQFQEFQALIATSNLLVDLLNTFAEQEGGSIDTSGGGGTFFKSSNHTIYVGNGYFPVGSNANNLYQIATSIGHELGHARLTCRQLRYSLYLFR